MKTYTIDEILDMGNDDFKRLETFLSEDEKELIIEQVKDYLEQRNPTEEFLHYYLEVRNTWRKLDLKVDSMGLDDFRKAIFASFAENWDACRWALEQYFSIHSTEMIKQLDISQWDYRHILKWFQMLVHTQLYKESYGSSARTFFLMIYEEGTVVRSSNLRGKFEKVLKQSGLGIDSLEGLIRETIHLVQ